jgi:hypothetical protein
MESEETAEELSPVTFTLSVNVQVYVVPGGTIVDGGLFVGAKAKASLLQTVMACAGIFGLGFTTTLYLLVSPGQPAAPFVIATAA